MRGKRIEGGIEQRGGGEGEEEKERDYIFSERQFIFSKKISGLSIISRISKLLHRTVFQISM